MTSITRENPGVIPPGRCLWLLLALVVGGCTEDRDQVGPPIRAGLDSADVELASYFSELYDAATKDPGSGAARGRLGMAYEVNDQPAAAERSYQQAMLLDPGEFRWPYYLALIRANRGEHDIALALLDQALAIRPDDVSAWLWRGTLLIEQGRDREAKQAFVRAMELGGGPPAVAGLARAQLHAGETRQAVERLEALTAEFPHPFLFRLLGRGYRALGRNDDAEIAMVRGRPSGVLAWQDEAKLAQWQYVRGFAGLVKYGQALLSLNRVKEAIDVFESVRSSHPDEEVLLNNLSAAYARVGRMSDSVEVLRHGVDVHPDSFSFHLNLAQRYAGTGEIERSLMHLDHALTLSPDLSSAHELKGEILMRRGDTDIAMESFRKAQSPRGYYFMGMIEGAREHWPSAIDSFEKSIALDPAEAGTYLYLGRSLAEVGRIEEAQKLLARGQRLGVSPDDFFSALQRVLALERRRSAASADRRTR